MPAFIAGFWVRGFNSMPLDGLYNTINALSEFNIAKESIDIIRENSHFIIKRVREQMSAGIKGDESNITINGRPYYKDFTEFIKERHGVGIGAYTDRITLYMTGDFHNSLRLIISGFNFFVTSDISYFNEIMVMVNDESVLDLTRENLHWFSEEILKPELQKRFDEAIRRNNNR